MSDDAYVHPNERTTSLTDPASKWTSWAFEHALMQSHAVLDSVAQELADALRMEPSLDHPCDVDGVVPVPGCYECQFVRKSRAALTRFDNLNKKGAAND